MAKVTTTFIASLSGFSSQSDGSLIDGNGNVRWLNINADSDAFVLSTAQGYSMSSGMLADLTGATANVNGSFTTAGGVTKCAWLWGLAEPSQGPPPPH